MNDVADTNENKLSEEDKWLIKKTLCEAFAITGLDEMHVENSNHVPKCLIEWFQIINRA